MSELISVAQLERSLALPVSQKLSSFQSVSSGILMLPSFPFKLARVA